MPQETFFGTWMPMAHEIVSLQVSAGVPRPLATCLSIPPEPFLKGVGRCSCAREEQTCTISSPTEIFFDRAAGPSWLKPRTWNSTSNYWSDLCNFLEKILEAPVHSYESQDIVVTFSHRRAVADRLPGPKFSDFCRGLHHLNSHFLLRQESLSVLIKKKKSRYRHTLAKSKISQYLEIATINLWKKNANTDKLSEDGRSSAESLHFTRLAVRGDWWHKPAFRANVQRWRRSHSLEW